MLTRTPEPELMDEAAQAAAYSAADFSASHNLFVARFRDCFGHLAHPEVADLGCGPCDVTVRFALAFPDSRITGIDGAEAMLALGAARIRETDLQSRITLYRRHLPAPEPRGVRYDTIISNSLLHHLADPHSLWATVRAWGKPGAAVFVMDLQRPEAAQRVAELTSLHTADAPAVLQKDFHASLHAAYRPAEIRAQLRSAGLAHWNVIQVSDRHLAVYGRLPLPEYAANA